MRLAVCAHTAPAARIQLCPHHHLLPLTRPPARRTAPRSPTMAVLSPAAIVLSLPVGTRVLCALLVAGSLLALLLSQFAAPPDFHGPRMPLFYALVIVPGTSFVSPWSVPEQDASARAGSEVQMERHAAMPPRRNFRRALAQRAQSATTEGVRRLRMAVLAGCCCLAVRMENVMRMLGRQAAASMQPGSQDAGPPMSRVSMSAHSPSSV